ncbi:MAG: hypothetical protein K6A65_05300, partial [Succinivibrionaceae bacterium]|nr:hypothetical protein [Succinivibrionaceae bacterium]
MQRFETHLFSRTAVQLRDVLNKKRPWMKCTHFLLSERGKTRQIDAPHIYDRQIQKLFTKEVLTKLYVPQMIWNNGASMKGKGLLFSQKIVARDLRRHFKKYGMNGWVITTDCKKFFPSADHDYIKGIHARLMFDTGIRDMADSIVDSAPDSKGMMIGIEPSQMEMVHYPTMLDTYMQCQLGLCGSGHYMDDFYALVPPAMDPKRVLEAIMKKAEENRITLSRKKTFIHKFGKPFRFCKAKYTITGTGRVIINGSRETAKRLRRKLNSF